MVKVGIIGDGYTVADLMRIFAIHDHVDVKAITSTDNIGRRLTDVYPHLTGLSDIVLEATEPKRLVGKVDAVFLALPHGLSVPLVAELTEAGIKCVDLGADFRLRDPLIYKKYYHLEHERPDVLKQAVYGLPEIYRAEIIQTPVVANPGCYPTSAILPLAPLLKAGVISTIGIIVDSKSGVSGAGKGLSQNTHFCEVNEGLKAYGVGTHRHGPEIEQELSRAADTPIKITFTPHLIPMNRGILTTAYANLAEEVGTNEVRRALEEVYAGERFVKVLPEGVFPQTKWVYGSNYVHIGIHVDPETGRVILVSALDNITKGASGQAVQNFNLMFGLDEAEALKAPGIFP
ncbi:MAG: N-acetyl-gamma-glutamyl-phosphate reductase [Ignavibacteriales bacterium]